MRKRQREWSKSKERKREGREGWRKEGREGGKRRREGMGWTEGGGGEGGREGGREGEPTSLSSDETG